jgi:exosortase/archaeosortase family protein
MTRPRARFVLALLAVLGAVAWYHRAPAHFAQLEPVASATTRATALALNALALRAERAGRVIAASGGGFRYEIGLECTALAEMALFAVAVAASAAPRRRKLWGLALGLPLLLALNLLRLVHLFALGVHAPQSFGPAHDVLWRGAMWAAVVGLFVAWRRGAPGRRTDAVHAARVVGGQCLGSGLASAQEHQDASAAGGRPPVPSGLTRILPVG